MFRQRLIRTMATAAFVTAMLTDGELRAQGLGFTIDPTQGPPGTVVNGQVDVADVAASCVTDLTEFQARFEDLSLNVLAFSAPDPLYLRFFPADVMDIITTILDVGGLTADKADHAQAILGEIRAKKGLSAPTHVLRAIPAGAAPAP